MRCLRQQIVGLVLCLLGMAFPLACYVWRTKGFTR